MPVFMTAFLLLAAGWDSTAANTTERNGSSYCACMTVPSPKDLDTVGRCVFFAKGPVVDVHRTARLNPVTTGRDVSRSFGAIHRGSLDPASLEPSGSLFGCASDRLSGLPGIRELPITGYRPYAVVNGLTPSRTSKRFGS